MFWVCFFFSSRRRHTRCGRDWSSDVCSSDLWKSPCPRRPRQEHRGVSLPGSAAPRRQGFPQALLQPTAAMDRSWGRVAPGPWLPPCERRAFPWPKLMDNPIRAIGFRAREGDDRGVDNLRGQLLIAGPALIDPNFWRTVILVGEHNEEGALGVVLNRP